jgi:hypothetical protein
MTFKELAIGQTFDWISGNMDSFFNRCTKVSARKYTDGIHVYRVGTIHAEVYHVAPII